MRYWSLCKHYELTRIREGFLDEMKGLQPYKCSVICHKISDVKTRRILYLELDKPKSLDIKKS